MSRAVWHDAYDSQMALWRFTRSTLGQTWMRRHYAINSLGMPESTKELLQTMYEAETDKLLASDPIYVSREMCEVVAAASASFGPEALLPTDLLTMNGFVWFEEPFPVPDRFNEPTTIQAASWAPAISVKKDEFGEWGGVALSIYARTEGETLPEPWANHVMPPAMLMHVTPWWFGMSFDGPEWLDIGEESPTGAEWWWRILQTTFRLMQQQLAVRHKEKPWRATRREAARLGFKEEREVVVVRLRRERDTKTPYDGPHEEANYSHRFIVSGHWRNHWYPKAAIHRQIWISPFVKGSPDLPLVVRPRRVYTWNR